MSNDGSSKHADAKKRVASVFTYLQELHRVRTPPVVDLTAYEWHLPLTRVPVGTTIRLGSRLSEHVPAAAGASAVIDSFLVRVGRPREEACPEPPAVIRKELRGGWEEPHARPRLKTIPPRPSDAEQDLIVEKAAFERERAFDAWLAEREAWTREQAPLALFSQLFELWTKFEREPEKYQLYLGDGVIEVAHPEGAIRHPILLQRLELRFDPRIPAFTISESEEAPEVYSPLLRHLNVDGNALYLLQRDFEASPCDPLGGRETDSFLKKLVHTLWPDAAYNQRPEPGKAPARVHLYREPAFYLGHRTHDLADAIDRYVQTVHQSQEGELPEALLRVVGVEPDRADSEGTVEQEVDMLLTHPANPEQERVIKRLAETGAVLVQGPPGTGKSHTIANLIGHLLAEKKTILVTSHASKALRVVREKVAAPLRSLCVSVLESDEESAIQLEESISGILNYLSSTSRKEIQKEIATLGEERDRLRAEKEELRTQLLENLTTEFGQLHIDGEAEAMTPAEAARKLAAEKDKHGWIPAPIDGTLPPPLTRAELNELYKLAATVQAKSATLAVDLLPNLERIPTPEVFADVDERLQKERGRESGRGSEYWSHEEQTFETLSTFTDRVEAAGRILAGAKGWVMECLAAGWQGKEATEPWRALAHMVRSAQKRIPPRMELVLKHGPHVMSDGLDWPLQEMIDVCSEIVQHLSAGKKLGGLARMFKREWQTFIKGVRVDNGVPESAEQFQSILDMLSIRQTREDLARRWDRQMVPYGAPSAVELGDAIEEAALPYAERMRIALGWAEEHLTPCEEEAAAIGLAWSKLVRDTAQPAGKHGELIRLRQIFSIELPKVLAAREAFISQHALVQQRAEWLGYLGAVAEEGGPMAAEFANAIRSGDVERYGELHRKCDEFSREEPALARKNALLARLEAVAPEWARAVRDRVEPHDGEKPPGDAMAAWSHRRWAQKLDLLSHADLDGLQTRLNHTTSALHKTTARYVEKLAWEAQLARVGLPEQQALAGWLALHKKIGKGSGKNAARLREEAKKTLVKCRKAVPVWIMPLSRVVENFDIADTKFDVVILDEASQCDILGLVCMAMGREVAVVGDHEQVSPYAVGHKVEKIQALIDELLHDIPNKQLYDGKTSVYDLARQSFGGTIRLLEHFRCVPEIIQFSNALCYGGEIRALREASSAQVRPPVIAHAIEGAVKEDKINEEEAREVAAIVASICEQPEYEGSTIGIISMVGTEQALLIDAFLRRRLTVAEYQRRRLLCGNASQFQGDERDIILLSVVDSPGGKKKRLPLKLRDDLKKVFNVAASRARDQLWVVHSLVPERDLKDGDLRLKLIQHAQNPDVLVSEGSASDDERAPSDFELAVHAALRGKGYRANLHGKVGNYRIDIVVEGGSGERVAVVCDGDRVQTPKELNARINRQGTLERLGWPFIRVPASRFFSDPAAVIERLCERLTVLGIGIRSQTVDVEPSDEARAGEELKSRVLKRAAEIRRYQRAAAARMPVPEGEREGPEVDEVDEDDLITGEPDDTGETEATPPGRDDDSENDDTGETPDTEETTRKRPRSRKRVATANDDVQEVSVDDSGIIGPEDVTVLDEGDRTDEEEAAAAAKRR